MTKVKKVGGRGTISYEKDEKPENWAGDSFREEQKDRLKKTGKILQCTQAVAIGQ